MDFHAGQIDHLSIKHLRAYLRDCGSEAGIPEPFSRIPMDHRSVERSFQPYGSFSILWTKLTLLALQLYIRSCNSNIVTKSGKSSLENMYTNLQ